VHRRQFIGRTLGGLAGAAFATSGRSAETAKTIVALRENWRDLLAPTATVADFGQAIFYTDEEWQRLLNRSQYRVLREEGTESPFSSPLNDEHRPGVYVCVACDLPLFTSAMKFESRTGWPSFFTTIPDAFGTKRDYFLILPRTEYHCARCGGHHGHVFDDGPAPTHERWCNNGVALRFIPRDG